FFHPCRDNKESHMRSVAADSRRSDSAHRRSRVTPSSKPSRWKASSGGTRSHGPEKVEVKTARRVKVPVNHVICTHLNHGKKSPLCSLGSRPIRKTHRRGCCAFLSGFKSHAVGCYAEPRRFTDRANPQRQHPIPIDVQRSVGIVAGRD